MARVVLHDLTVEHHDRRSRAATVALDRIDLDIGDGELVAVIGPSGSGKTTLLRAIAGLDAAAGTILMDADDVTALPPSERDVAMVFQFPHLLPHRTVGRNVAFPLEVRRETIAEIRTRVSAEARALHIETLLGRSPQELSAGEAQLVQIARALVRVPRVLLLDEPLARLDAHVRERMRRELRLLQRGYGVTTILTTNDPVEAMAMADQLVVLDAGRVVQAGPPLDVHREPASLLVAQLTGALDTAMVEVTADSDGYWLRGPEGVERAWRPSLAAHVGGWVVRGVRPDGTRLLFQPDTGLRLA